MVFVILLVCVLSAVTGDFFVVDVACVVLVVHVCVDS